MERKPEGEAISEVTDARRFNKIMGRGMVQLEYRRLARTLAGFDLPKKAAILDVGTGTGYVALEVAAALPTACVTGIDLSEAMLNLARENSHSRGLDHAVVWKNGHADAMPFEDDEFDAVISSGSLHHWENPVQVFNEIERVVRPGGRVIVRDSKRVKAWSFAGLIATLIGLSLPADFRRHYWGSIRSSYTATEVTAMMEQSRLKGVRIKEDVIDLMIIR
jgi:ubiquinone/menaquinone biosynthesis C-methylase UbiE